MDVEEGEDVVMRKKMELPPKIDRPIFVQYIAVRKCRFNPSVQRFARLPAYLQLSLIDQRKTRHPKSPLPILPIKWEGL